MTRTRIIFAIQEPIYRINVDSDIYCMGLIIRPILKKWDEEKNLPVYLRERYAFYSTRLLQSKMLLVVLKTDGEPTPSILAKHIQKVREKWPDNIAFVNEGVSSLDRKRLIEQNIPFIIPGNQMFLPMHGLDLREHFRKIHMDRSAFSPSTQVLILDAIYGGGEPIYTAAVAKRFGYTAMTMSRVFDEFEQVGLGIHSVHGRARKLVFPSDKKKIWTQALPYLKSPVKKRAYLTGLPKKMKYLGSGLCALSEYSSLSRPLNNIVALDGKEWLSLRSNEIIVETRSPDPDWPEAEVWAYPPGLFGKNGIVDPLSVYLSLMGSEDERVQGALQELLERNQW